MPEVTAPEASASAMPAGLAWARLCSSALKASAMGAARRKLPAVAASGLACPRPRSEYTPQATPATAISAAPSGVGAVTPGETRYTSPPSASTKPSQPSGSNRSPARRPAPSMVSCTAPTGSAHPCPR